MNSTFARTLRALDADDFRVSNVVLVLVVLLLGAWTWWLFAGRVAQYETSSSVRVEPNRFVATFPARVLDHVRPGQSATVEIDGATVPARVAAIGLDAATSQIQVILLAATESPAPAAGKSARGVGGSGARVAGSAGAARDRPRESMKARARLIVPEVVQTSNMDCGPAALKCLLEGFGIHVHYGRLREACQTDVDGTSIDTLEDVANQLGLEAEQIMLPADHVLLDDARALPAIAVVILPNGMVHFVVAVAAARQIRADHGSGDGPPLDCRARVFFRNCWCTTWRRLRRTGASTRRPMIFCGRCAAHGAVRNRRSTLASCAHRGGRSGLEADRGAGCRSSDSGITGRFACDPGW